MGVWETLTASFIGALVAVTLTHLAERAWHRRVTVEELVLGVRAKLPQVIEALTAGEKVAGDANSDHRIIQTPPEDRLVTDLIHLVANARMPLRRAKEIRREALDLLARVLALLRRADEGRPFDRHSVEADGVSAARLDDLVRGKRNEGFVDAATWYTEYGFLSRYLGTPER